MSRKRSRQQAAGNVRAAFDPDVLKRVCQADSEEFVAYGPRTELAPDRWSQDRFYHYIDRGASVLAVAHLDTVQRDRRCQVTETAAGLLVTSGALDDRLGAYVILELLPRLGIEVDVLLTTDEEQGASTAAEFPGGPRDYNWMFSFDRGGTDVVMYQYETDELVRLVREAGSHVGHGIWSDICTLDHLGCAGLNWGVGYQDYHSPRGHAWLDDTFRMVASFVKFYNANKDTHLFSDEQAIDMGLGYEDWDPDDEDWDDPIGVRLDAILTESRTEDERLDTPSFFANFAEKLTETLPDLPAPQSLHSAPDSFFHGSNFP